MALPSHLLQSMLRNKLCESFSAVIRRDEKGSERTVAVCCCVGDDGVGWGGESED